MHATNSTRSPESGHPAVHPAEARQDASACPAQARQDAPGCPAQAPAACVPHVGLDVGSTTTKAVALDPATGRVLFSRYRRHHARQAASAADAIAEVAEQLGVERMVVAVTGSGARDIASELGAVYVQEVVANSIAVRALWPQARCAIELGGQDAKMLFFRCDEASGGEPVVSDMRMNGSCAGGTGAFIDEMAKLLGVEEGSFETLAAAGTTVYDVSGRCGVYAKTDIQPLLNQGIPRSDLALSALHAVARQTIGGLAQGIEIEAPVIFEGGTLAYHPTLVRAFTEQLYLGEDGVLIPEEPQLVVARGAALALVGPLGAEAATLEVAEAVRALRELQERPRSESDAAAARPLFASADERRAFERRHPAPKPVPGPAAFARGTRVHAYLGIDSGSTTSKFALIDRNGALLDSFYASNEGRPLDVVRAGLLDLRQRWHEAGVELAIDAVGTTGYGEQLLASALHADYHTVETVAHARAATTCVPDATFVLDIGGQDMKAIWLTDGVLTDIVVNEACSAGCGSFLEGFAAGLGIPVEGIAQAAFRSQAPAELGSRCTVFMNSSVVSEQRRGKGPDDIMAGLCRSIIENVFTKVIRVSNLDRLGERVVVQGGTFANDAVLRAFEQYLGREVTRAPYPGLMGAIGIALLAAEQVGEGAGAAAGAADADKAGAAGEGAPGAGETSDAGAPDADAGRSSFIGLDALEDFTHAEFSGITCTRCANRCARSVTIFGDGTLFVTGNRCARGEDVTLDELLAVDPDAGELAAAAAGSREGGASRPAGASCPTAVPHLADASRPTGASRSDAPAPAPANLFDERERLLFQERPVTPLAPERGVTIGIPRVLQFWDSLPFWSTFLRALGFGVHVSRRSTRAMYERGLPHVTSDTVCFPAKLVHGHVRDLADAHVDRIFMPIITAVPSENVAPTSEWMCAVVKGYPYVMRNSDNPQERFGIPFDTPLFHWYDKRDRNRQLAEHMRTTFGIEPSLTAQAIHQADAAQDAFTDELQRRGAQVIDEVRASGGYAIVLASRPYHNDPLVNHGLPRMLCEMGIPVLTPDAVPGVREVDLSRSRLDIVNNFHTRMLGSAVIAAATPELEYVQLVSFGCGHDAYLSDEIVRLMKEVGASCGSTKAPLILKLDESEVAGPLRIRVRSFVETVGRRRAAQAQAQQAAGASQAQAQVAAGGRGASSTSRAGSAAGASLAQAASQAQGAASAGVPSTAELLPDPYPTKYVKSDRREKVILVPNTSHAFSRLMSAAISTEGVRAEALEIGRDEAIRLGKRYVHNDICFPAQICVGEALAALESGKYDSCDVAIGTGKYIGDCRLTHYMPLLRRALDDAGYAHVPLITNDNDDAHNAYPGYRMGLKASLEIVAGLPMIDALEALLRQMRPYELRAGEADAAFERALDALMDGIKQGGVRGAETGFKRSIEIMKQVRYDRSHPRPRVLIVGEYLLNFHPGANHEVERYLEAHGMEVIEARMTDVIRKTYFYRHAQSREYHVDLSKREKAWNALADGIFEVAHDRCDRIAAAHPLYEPPTRLPELAKRSDEVLHHTFDAGEGILIPGEILEHASKGCRAFIILQPFGCLPNHVVGRGLISALKRRYPDAQFLPLDYDPDVSFANVENRLQMLIMTERERERRDGQTA